MAAAAISTGACTLYRVAAAPVKLTAKAVEVAGETTGAVIVGGGKIVCGGARAIGDTGSAGLDAAARLAREDMVTFVNAADGRVSRVPWQRGLRLGAAAAKGRVKLAGQGLELIRDGRVVHAAARGADAVLAAGDVVRLLH